MVALAEAGFDWMVRKSDAMLSLGGDVLESSGPFIWISKPVITEVRGTSHIRVTSVRLLLRKTLEFEI